MAENVMLFLCHQVKNFCFIMLVVLVNNFCALISYYGLATAIGIITDFVRMVIACSPYLRRLAPLLLPVCDLLPDLLTLSVAQPSLNSRTICYCGEERTRTSNLTFTTSLYQCRTTYFSNALNAPSLIILNIFFFG